MDYVKELQKRKSHIVCIVKMFADIGAPLPSIYIQNAGKIAFLPTHIPSTSSIDFQFFGIAKKLGLLPVWSSYIGDKYTSLNKRKTMYLKPFDVFGDQTILAHPKDWEGKRLNDIEMLRGGLLVDYHFGKWHESFGGKRAFCFDQTDWLKKFREGKAEDYYYYVMLLYTFFGIKFWPANINALYREGEKGVLQEKAMQPARQRVKDEFGFEPLEYYFELLPTMHT